MPPHPALPPRRRRLRALLACTLAPGFAAAAAPAMAAEPPHVLLLLRGSAVAPWPAQFAEALRATVMHSQPRAELDVEVMPVTPAEQDDAPVAGWLRQKYGARRFDVVVVSSPDQVALGVALRDRLWPAATVAACGLQPRQAMQWRAVPRVVGRVAHDGVTPNLALMFHLRPQTRHIAVIASSVDADPLRPQWRAALAPWLQRAQLLDLSGLDAESLQGSLRRLPADTVVYLAPPGGTSMAGVRMPADYTPELARAASVPIVTDTSPLLGSGVLGGYVVSPLDYGRDAGDQVVRLLAGTPARRIGFEPHTPPRLVLDWRALQRWGLRAPQVPPEAELQFRPPGLWEAYRGSVLAAAALLLVQSGLIAALLLERRRRRRAELRARQHLRELARLNRGMAAAALSGALAHEINQPLGAILSNAETAELLLDGPASEAQRQALRALLAAIRADDQRAAAVLARLRAWIADVPSDPQRHALNPLVQDTLALLRSELSQRETEAVLQLGDDVPPVQVDAVQLQQVVLNLVVNAVQAMQALPARERRVTLTTARQPGGAATLTVADRGPGLGGLVRERLFEPFFSTKDGGLGVGLSISRSIVERHGGQLWAQDAPGGGACFCVELPAA